MFLKQSKYKTGRIFLSIMEGYRDPISKRPKQRTVKKIGYLDELVDQYPNPIEYFKNYAHQLTVEKNQQLAKFELQIDPQEKMIANQNNRKNFGYAALSHIYHQLKLDQFINNRSRHKKFGFNANTLFKNAVYSRILYPGSKKADFENRHLFFESTDYSLDDMYRNLDFIADLENSCQTFLNQQIQANYGRKKDLVYYDVTNYYFEIDEPTNLQKKGVSKEHRPNPIIQMGLLMDQEGIPISYRLYPGNTNDCLTYRPFIKQAKLDLGLGRIVVVADKAMNTGDNIWYTLSAKNGYVFSQSIRGASRALKDYVLNESDYTQFGEGFKMKSRLEPRDIWVTMKSGKKKKVQVDEKQIVFYSEKYARRARFERAKALEKARKIVKNPGLYDHSTANGAVSYVKNLQFNKSTGEIFKPEHQLSIDEAKIAAEEKLDGYYMLLTSEIDKSDTEVLEMYRGLWQIEENFKITKSDLLARPVFVRREKRIRAHFLICFVALTILRLIQRDLGYAYSAKRIAADLRKCEGTLFEKNLYVFSYFSPILAALANKYQLPFDRKYLTQREIKKILSETK